MELPANSKTCNTLSIQALQIAQSQIGQEEEPRGSNSGKMTDEYLRAVGLNGGYAWCQAFVYWCYKQAAEQQNALNPMIRTAGVYDCWNRAGTGKQKSSTTVVKILKTQVLLDNAQILPGDQFIMTFGRSKGHTGIVERVEKTGDDANPLLLHTIEGNSNDQGCREGYAVVRRTRAINEKALQGFIRYE